MKLSMFKNGINIYDLRNFVDLQKSFCDEHRYSENEAFKVEEISSENNEYFYYTATSKNMISKIYLVHRSNGKSGLSVYDVNSDSIIDLTPCEYDIVEFVCNDTFVLKSILGKSVLVSKCKMLYPNLYSINAYEIGSELFVLLITDSECNVNFIMFTDSSNDIYFINSVNEFIDRYSKTLIVLNSKRALDDYSVKELNEFRDRIALTMLNCGYRMC